MQIECDTFYFYPDNTYVSTSNWNNTFGVMQHDVKEYSRSIRILGTRKQIENALDAYCESSGLNLDECYKYENKERIKQYMQHYKNKALIINLL